jgi:glucose-6-phosphate isomerase
MPYLKERSVVVSKFTELKAYKKLKILAENPFDLTEERNLTPERISKFSATSCGYKFLYGTERVTEEVMKTLLELATEANALDKMHKMQNGEVLNFIEGYPSENRAVLHTATRDFFENPNTTPAAAEAAKTARKEAERLKKFINKLDDENKFSNLILIGIGGSDLGPHAQYLGMLNLLKSGRTVRFIPNIDPDAAASVLQNLDLNRSLVLVISKTGTTLETVTNEEIVRSHFKKAGLKPEEHFISATGEGSPLDDKSQYLESFHTWDWVGGRFSSSSMIGGVLIAFAFGFDAYWEYLKGANAMDKAALDSDSTKNIPLLGALIGIWNRNFLHHSNLAIIPYSQGLSRYSAHVQQVDMESNGKHIDQQGNPVDFETGPIVFGEPGTNAQHSFYQLIHQGTTIIPLELIGFKDSQFGIDQTVQGTTSQEKLLANLFAQIIALALGQKSDNPNKEFVGNRPSHLLLAKKLTPFAVGALLAYFEHKIAFQGFIWHINSFDQEGVQLGKSLANRILSLFAEKRSKSESKPFPLGTAFIDQLKNL